MPQPNFLEVRAMPGRSLGIILNFWLVEKVFPDEKDTMSQIVSWLKVLYIYNPFRL